MFLSSLVLAAVLQQPSVFYEFGPYSSKVPKPAQSLGYQIGHRHTTYREQDQCLKAIATASPGRVKEFVFGKSTEGRPLRVYAISSPNNISKLDALRKANVALAEKPGPEQTGPAFVWINECIHGDETASFESAMALIYNLAATENRDVKSALENCVVLVNPSYNPDGHERFVVWFNSIAVGSPRDFAMEHDVPSSVNGRTNHYRFDMNRDRISLSQIESQQEVREFLRWRPQVYVDQHGETSSYFFPPTPMSVNSNVDRNRYNKWTEKLGRATAQTFDKHDWTYFVREEFDFYYPGYLDSWTTLSGAIGMTHETDGGSNLASMRDDGTIATLASAAEKHFSSAMSVILTSAKNHKELLADYAKFMARNVSGEHAGKNRYVIVAHSSDEWLNRQFMHQLELHGIRAVRATGAFESSARSFFGGSESRVEFPNRTIIIDLAQPQGALAKALVEPESNFEPEFVKQQLEIFKLLQAKEKYPSPDRPNFYDTTAWSIVFGNGLTGYWCETKPEFASSGLLASFDQSKITPDAVGWYWPYRSLDDVLRASELLQDNVRVQIADKAMVLDGETIPRGSFVVMKFRNEAGVEEKLKAKGSAFASAVRSIKTSFPDIGGNGPGTSALRSLAKPSIGVVFGSAEDYLDFGAIWWLLEKLGVPFTPLQKSRLGAEIDRFSCLIFPDGYSGVPDSKMRDWVRNGGTAITLGNPGWMLGDSGFVKLEETKIDGKQPTFLPGLIARAEMDTRYPLTFGYSERENEKLTIAVPFAGNRFYRALPEGGGVVVCPTDSKAKRVLSGWTWPDETEKALEGALWLHDQPVGRGHAILFMRDPTDRAMWPAFNKLLINAMFLMSPPRN